ncbi:MAG: isoprenylcysteine carboxylmethyltransferase family protein [Chloroflexi bacterium]|nr:isoprenylcysteine carboxylmethyltransferase family protein [Chloroflexota bacterium]
MTSPLTIICATILYAVVHSLLATLGAKARARQLFGLAADRWYRLAYNIFAGISFLPILWLMVVLPDQRLYAIPFPWVIVTSLGQVASVVIIVLGIWQADAWSFIGIRQVLNPTLKEEKPELIINGLYQWMRHPLYTGGLLFLWLTPVMTINALTLTIILTIYLVVGAKFEERRLLFEFGDAYIEYQNQVPMLVPRIRRKT